MKYLHYGVNAGLWALLLLAAGINPYVAKGQQRQFIFEQVQGVWMQPATYSMDTDEYGRLWYGTWGRGVFVYNGYSFNRYQSTPGDSNSLVNDRIIDLEADQRQRVWVSTMNGLDCIERKTGQIRHFQASGDSIFQFMAVYEDKSGQIWASGAKGILRFQELTQSFENIRPEGQRAATARPNVFYEDANGTLWLGRSDGLVRFSPDRNRYDYIPVHQIGFEDEAFRVGAIVEDRQHHFWIGGYDGLMLFDRKTGQVSRPALPDSLAFERISALVLDAEGRIWMAVSQKGLYCWTPENGELRRYQHNELDPLSLPSNNVYSLLYDLFGNLWVGTDHGLGRLNLLPQPFSKWLIEPGNPEKISNNVLHAAQDSLGGILIRTQKDMYYLKEFGGKPIPLLPDINRPKIFEPDDLIQDKTGHVWAIYDGLFRWNPAQLKFIKVITPLNKVRILSLEQDHEDANIWWLGTLQGLHRFDQVSGEIRLFKDICKAGQARGIGKILDDGLGHLWLSAPATLIRFDKKTASITFFSTKTPAPHQLPNDEVLDLRMAPDGWIWVSTAAGITRIDPITGDFHNLTQQDGLPDNLALTVLFDHKGNAWLIFPEHIVRRDAETGVLRSWNTANMLQTGQFARGGGCILRNGCLLIAARGGIIQIDPLQLKERLAPKCMVLTRLETSEKGKKRDFNPEFLQHIQLANEQNNITIEWAGIQTAQPGELLYECKLERQGEQTEWEFKGVSRQTVYANLEPGAYTFKVRIVGMESPETSLSIAIAPAWWQAESFKMLLMALLVTAAYLFWRNQEDRRELLQQKDLAEQNARYKTRFLTNMSHEIRTPMNAILGLSRLLTESALPPKQSEYADAIRQSSENLLVIVNDVLDQAKIESGKFSFQHKSFDLTLIVRHLQNTLGFKAAEKGLLFGITIAPDTPTRLLGDPVRLNQILTNLLGNAIKFTERGRVELAVAVDKSHRHKSESLSQGSVASGTFLRFAVSDTGIGMTAEQGERVFESFQQADDDISANYGGTGLGLSITKDLVEQQNGNIQLESEVGKGTTITARIPFELDHKPDLDPTHSAASPITFGNLRILLVEDTFFNQMLAAELLKSRIPGMVMEIAENGLVALEKVEAAAPYDLVLMDVKMPVMDGLEATRRLRMLPEGKRLPIIALTANAVQAELDKCAEAGMDACVTKPIDADELFSTMQKVLKEKMI